MKRHMNTCRPLTANIILASLTGFQSMAAADKSMLKKVIVTAQKRAHSLQEVAINTVYSEIIKDINISSIATLAGSVRSLKTRRTGTANQVGINDVFSGPKKGFEHSVCHTCRQRLLRPWAYYLARSAGR